MQFPGSGKEERGQGNSCTFPLKKMIRKHTHPRSQNPAAWPHQAAREAGKCGL